MNKNFSTIIIVLCCSILSLNALRSITESYKVGSVFVQRKKDTEQQYLEVIKKKNELDYINSPFFVEKQLRESMNFYRNGEKLLVFTRPVLLKNQEIQKATVVKNSYFQEWIDLIKYGVVSPKEAIN